MIELPDGPEALVAVLEAAGKTLLALPEGGIFPAGVGAAWPSFVREMVEAYGYDEARPRMPAPTARQIEEMGVVFGWVGTIPNDRYVLRRLLLLRSLVHPLSDRHSYSWRDVARMVGTNHFSVRVWHGQGLRLVLEALRKRGAA